MDTAYFYFEINGFHHEKNESLKIIEKIKDTSAVEPKNYRINNKGEKNRKS